MILLSPGENILWRNFWNILEVFILHTGLNFAGGKKIRMWKIINTLNLSTLGILTVTGYAYFTTNKNKETRWHNLNFPQLINQMFNSNKYANWFELMNLKYFQISRWLQVCSGINIKLLKMFSWESQSKKQSDTTALKSAKKKKKKEKKLFEDLIGWAYQQVISKVSYNTLSI